MLKSSSSGFPCDKKDEIERFVCLRIPFSLSFFVIRYCGRYFPAEATHSHILRTEITSESYGRVGPQLQSVPRSQILRCNKPHPIDCRRSVCDLAEMTSSIFWSYGFLYWMATILFLVQCRADCGEFSVGCDCSIANQVCCYLIDVFYTLT